jgi:hypothetical protein
LALAVLAVQVFIQMVLKVELVAILCLAQLLQMVAAVVALGIHRVLVTTAVVVVAELLMVQQVRAQPIKVLLVVLLNQVNFGLVAAAVQVQ